MFHSPPMYHFEKQPIASMTQGPDPVVVQNTWYTVLPYVNPQSPVRLLYIAVRRFDDDVNAKNVQIRVTIDGNAILGNRALNDNTWYYLRLTPEGDNTAFTVDVSNVCDYTDLRGKEVLVEVRQTVAPGANAVLDGRVQFEVLRRKGAHH